MSLATPPRQALAAGFATLCAAGSLVGGTAGAAAGGVRAVPRASYSKTLTDVVAPGTLASTTWTIPTGDTFQLTKLTVQSSGGSLGAIRVQRLVDKSNPETLLEADPAAVRPAFSASLYTPLTFDAGQAVALTVSCDGNQAACTVTTTVTGQLSKSVTHGDAFFSTLDVVAAPGTTGSTSWTVPAKDEMSFTDLLASALGSGQPGGLDVVVTPKGSPQRDLLRMKLAKLETRPFDYRLAGPVNAGAGSTITLTVKCPADEPACNVDVLFAGPLS
jgi:hypothetical protein